jgi:hypothetical protein
MELVSPHIGCEDNHVISLIIAIVVVFEDKLLPFREELVDCFIKNGAIGLGPYHISKDIAHDFASSIRLALLVSTAGFVSRNKTTNSVGLASIQVLISRSIVSNGTCAPRQLSFAGFQLPSMTPLLFAALLTFPARLGSRTKWNWRVTHEYFCRMWWYEEVSSGDVDFDVPKPHEDFFGGYLVVAGVCVGV